MFLLYMIVGIAIAFALWALLKALANAPPGKVAAGAKMAGAGLGALGALWLVLTGRIGVAVALGQMLGRLFGARAEAGPQGAPPPQQRPGAMERAEAARLLGVPADADAETVKAAHRRLMMKVHPDHGGSDYLAAKLNEAKKTLLGE
jgi:hypothetical protein